MKRSHTYSLATIATAAVVFNFSSCKIDENDAPNIPFKTSRITGLWDVYSIGGNPLGTDYELEMGFDADGDFSFTYSYDYYGYIYSYSSNGKWSWSSDKETLKVNLDGSRLDFDINEITENEMSWDYYGDEWVLRR